MTIPRYNLEASVICGVYLGLKSSTMLLERHFETVLFGKAFRFATERPGSSLAQLRASDSDVAPFALDIAEETVTRLGMSQTDMDEACRVLLGHAENDALTAALMRHARTYGPAHERAAAVVKDLQRFIRRG